MFKRDATCLQAKLYPDFVIAHMPSASMQGIGTDDSNGHTQTEPGVHASNGGSKRVSQHGSLPKESSVVNVLNKENDGIVESPHSVDCCNILANAPVHGDHYDYHVDADPLTLPDSDWHRIFGDYCNR